MMTHCHYLILELQSSLPPNIFANLLVAEPHSPLLNGLWV